MTAIHTVSAVTAALIAKGTVTIITDDEQGIDGRVLIRADAIHMGSDEAMRHSVGVVVKPGHIVASGTVEWVPIHPADELLPLAFRPGDNAMFVGPNELWADTTWTIDRADQLPYGDFTVGRWAGILTDIRATTERCPTCWGTSAEGFYRDEWVPCETCGFDGTCPPIPCDDMKEWMLQ